MVHAHDGPRGLPQYPLYTIVYFSDDKGASWQRTTRPLQANMTHDLVGGEHGFWETALVELSTPGHLLMLGRTCSGWLAESRSTDFGKTWTVPAHNKQLPHPLAPPNLARLPGGALLLLTEPHLLPEAGGLLGTRYVLAAQVSHDEGRSWGGYRELQYTGAAHTQDYASIFVDDQTVHITRCKSNACFPPLFYRLHGRFGGRPHQLHEPVQQPRQPLRAVHQAAGVLLPVGPVMNEREESCANL